MFTSQLQTRLGKWIDLTSQQRKDTNLYHIAWADEKDIFHTIIAKSFEIVSNFSAVQPDLIGSSSYMNSNGICTTEPCLKVAQRILNNMNTSVDPCEDFHQVRFITNDKINCVNYFRLFPNRAAAGADVCLQNPMK